MIRDDGFIRDLLFDDENNGPLNLLSDVIVFRLKNSCWLKSVKNNGN